MSLIKNFLQKQFSFFFSKKTLLLFVIFLNFGPPSQAQPFAVVSQEENATKAGFEILKKGGNAIDAAIATAFTLSVTEPYNSGIGGGGFALYYEKATQKVYFIDYREVASQKIETLIQKNKINYKARSAASIGLPGFVSGMGFLHQKWGKLSWQKTLKPAQKLAINGFALNKSLKKRILKQRPILGKDNLSKEIFLKPVDAKLKTIKQQKLGEFLQMLANQGPKSFYQGKLAGPMVRHFKKLKTGFSKKDFTNYQTKQTQPFQIKWRDLQIYTAAGPSFAGLAYQTFLKEADQSLKNKIPFSAEAHLEIAQLLKKYLAKRKETASSSFGHTSHLAVIDAKGNIVVMTNSLNYPFGSGQMIPEYGIILNNELDDFNWQDPTSIHRPQNGQRPPSSMAPTLVFKKDTSKPLLAIGTPGGMSIPQNLVQVLWQHFEWKLPLNKAIEQPKISVGKENKIYVEEKMPDYIQKNLQTQFQVQTRKKIGNVQVLVFDGLQIKTLSDPRGYGSGLVSD